MERIQRAERLCAAQEARTNAFLKRMGLSIQKGTLPSPEPSASSGHGPESSDITDELGAISWGIQFNGLPSPKLPAAPERIIAVKPQRGTILGTKTVKCDLHPSFNASQSLSLCFEQLKSVDWEKKMEGLKIIQALARHHQALLKTNLHHVCQVVTDEVKHGRCCVVFAPIDTITELHVHLGKNMDPEVDWTGCVLLLKLAQTTQTFIHQRVNLALDALVKGCSPGRVVITLLNFGLSHQCHRVRESTALHLHQLTEIVGENWIVTAERHFAERFLTSVCKLTLDAATEVR
ncbi:Interferon inducible Mx protein [Scophthalmus maximus]|uniref:Interferon inducible Mx protein n=1 Tax=Scophthalmus maximus TaxID=52904 RepID=A0A2U9BMS6_SCOMX|nr:Interferon inducible Mx protein [Scophthalmus maximus]